MHRASSYFHVLSVRGMLLFTALVVVGWSLGSLGAGAQVRARDASDRADALAGIARSVASYSEAVSTDEARTELQRFEVAADRLARALRSRRSKRECWEQYQLLNRFRRRLARHVARGEITLTAREQASAEAAFAEVTAYFERRQQLP